MQVCTSLQTDNHASTPPLSFLQAGCPSCHPTNSVKALKAHITLHYIIKNKQLQKSLDLAARRALPNPLGGQKSHEQGASTAARGFNHPDSTPPPMNSNNARQCLTMNQTEDTVRRC